MSTKDGQDSIGEKAGPFSHKEGVDKIGDYVVGDKIHGEMVGDKIHGDTLGHDVVREQTHEFASDQAGPDEMEATASGKAAAGGRIYDDAKDGAGHPGEGGTSELPRPQDPGPGPGSQ